MDSSTVSYIIVMAICVLMSAYFSATETAFSSLNRTRIKTMAEKEDKRAILVLKLSENYDKLISTILIGNNIVNILLASFGTVFFTKYYHDMGATISTVVVTIVVLIFGEISPKSIAKDSPEKFASFSAPYLRVFLWILTPLNFVFTLWKKLLDKILKIEDDSKMSQEELLMLVEEVQQEGSIGTSEGDLLRNAIEFTDREAEDILTHRVDLEAITLEDTKEEIAKVFTQSGYSRLLVYEETIDNIIGVIHQKDFYVGTGITKKDIKDIVSPPLFIHKSEKISELLTLFQKEKSHIAIVIDEYGGTLGIVTMEDILEELVGEIWDEHDEIVEDFQKIDDKSYFVDGNVNIDDFCEFFDIETETDSVSLGGWVMEQLDSVPHKDDKFSYENLEITVTETDSHRVVTVKVLCNEKTDEEMETKNNEK